MSDCRLAMRVEGKWWVAYLARVGSMDDATEMGRILLTAVINPERKQAFIDLMTGFLAEGMEAIGAGTPDWEQQKAPESERSGSA